VFSETPSCPFIVFFADRIVFSVTPLYNFILFSGTPLCQLVECGKALSWLVFFVPRPRTQQGCSNILLHAFLSCS
jgi:hypothetical protein